MCAPPYRRRMYLRAPRDGRPDVLARLTAVPPMHPGASSDLTADRPVATAPDDPDDAGSPWSWDDPIGARGIGA